MARHVQPLKRAMMPILTTSTPIRPYHVTATARLPYKDTQDRESLRPSSAENTKSGRDEEAAQTDAAFNPRKTTPEEAGTAGAEGNPIHATGGNQELSKPQGDEKSSKGNGPGMEIGKGGTSRGASSQKKGSPSKV